jgi:hypothetical protein
MIMMEYKANQSDHRFRPGDWVEYGTSSPHGGDRLGEIVFEHREYGQDGYLIQPLSGFADEGTLPSIYPGRMVYGPMQPERWAYDAPSNRFHRTYAEVRPRCPDCGGTGITYVETDCGGCSGYPGIAHEPTCGTEPCPRGCEVPSHA